MNNKTILAALFLLLLNLTLPAQEKRNLIFRAVATDSKISEISYGAADKLIKLSIPKGYRSTAQKYTGPSAIQFYDTSAPPVDGKFPLVAKANIPKSISVPLLIFIPKHEANEEKTRQYHVLVISDTPKDFPSGSYKIVNLTNKSLHIALGDDGSEKFSVKPYSHYDGKITNSKTVSKRFKAYVKVDRKMKEAAHSRIFPDKESRTLFFAYPENNPKSNNLIRVSSVTETISTYKLAMSSESLNPN